MFSITVVLLKLIFILIQTIFIIGVAPILSRPLINPTRVQDQSKFRDNIKVAVLLPFHKEHPLSVMRTARSIANQTYPPELITVYILIEGEDNITRRSIPTLVNFFRFRGMSVRVIYTQSTYIGKPRAMNQALPHVEEDVVVVFDADDIVPEKYISLVVGEIKKGAAAVTTKVYRLGDRLHSKFIALDTFIWYDIYLPVYMKFIGYAPMSGEGLAVRREILNKIGGFPESLTEDAYLTIELAKIGEKISYLDSIFIIERAPLSFKALINQRMRWFKGYYECLRALWRYRRDLGHLKTLKLAVTYMGPIISMATTLSYTIFFFYIFGSLFGAVYITSLIKSAISGPVYYLAAFMFFGGNLFFTGIILYYFSDTRFESYTPYIYVAFIYWYIIGIVALLSLFSSREWYKTERIGYENA